MDIFSWGGKMPDFNEFLFEAKKNESNEDETNNKDKNNGNGSKSKKEDTSRRYSKKGDEITDAKLKVAATNSLPAIFKKVGAIPAENAAQPQGFVSYEDKDSGKWWVPLLILPLLAAAGFDGCDRDDLKQAVLTPDTTIEDSDEYYDDWADGFGDYGDDDMIYQDQDNYAYVTPGSPSTTPAQDEKKSQAGQGDTYYTTPGDFSSEEDSLQSGGEIEYPAQPDQDYTNTTVENTSNVTSDVDQSGFGNFSSVDGGNQTTIKKYYRNGNLKKEKIKQEAPKSKQFNLRGNQNQATNLEIDQATTSKK